MQLSSAQLWSNQMSKVGSPSVNWVQVPWIGSGRGLAKGERKKKKEQTLMENNIKNEQFKNQQHPRQSNNGGLDERTNWQKQRSEQNA